MNITNGVRNIHFAIYDRVIDYEDAFTVTNFSIILLYYISSIKTFIPINPMENK